MGNLWSNWSTDTGKEIVVDGIVVAEARESKGITFDSNLEGNTIQQLADTYVVAKKATKEQLKEFFNRVNSRFATIQSDYDKCILQDNLEACLKGRREADATAVQISQELINNPESSISSKISNIGDSISQMQTAMKEHISKLNGKLYDSNVLNTDNTSDYLNTHFDKNKKQFRTEIAKNIKKYSDRVKNMLPKIQKYKNNCLNKNEEGACLTGQREANGLAIEIQSMLSNYNSNEIIESLDMKQRTAFLGSQDYLKTMLASMQNYASIMKNHVQGLNKNYNAGEKTGRISYTDMYKKSTQDYTNELIW